MYLLRNQVKKIVEKSIIERIILEITYDHTSDKPRSYSKRMAPFDFGTSNPKYYEKNKDNLYVFCFDHKDDITFLKIPHVHPISSLHIINILETDENFDPIEVTNIHFMNKKYDYRMCKWAIVPERNWY